MAVRFAKTVAVPAVKAPSLPSVKVGGHVVSVGSLLAAEYIEVYKELKAFGTDAKLARMEEIRKSLLTLTADMEADKPAVFVAEAGELEFTKVPESRCVLDPLAVILSVKDTHGVEAAQSIAKVTISDLEMVLSENEIAPLVKMKPGTRRLVEVRPAATEEVA